MSDKQVLMQDQPVFQSKEKDKTNESPQVLTNPVLKDAEPTQKVKLTPLGLALKSLDEAKTQIGGRQQFFIDAFKGNTSIEKNTAQSLAAFVLAQTQDQSKMDDLVKKAKDDLEAAPPEQKEALSAAYLEVARAAVVLYRENESFVKMLEEESQKPEFAIALKRAAEFKVRPWDAFDDSREKLVERNMMRNLAFRSMIATSFYAESTSLVTRDWEKDYENFVKADKELVEKGHQTQEQLDKKMSYENAYRFEIPPQSMIPKNKEERTGDYKVLYDRMDYSLLMIGQAQRQLTVPNDSDDQPIKDFKAELSKVLFGFQSVFYKTSMEAEEKARKKDFKKEDRDKLMTELAGLSFRFGALALQVFHTSSHISDHFKKMTPEEKEQFNSAFSVMSQAFIKQVPSDKDLIKNYNLASSLRVGNELINNASGVCQYAEGLAMKDEEFKQKLEEQERKRQSALQKNPDLAQVNRSTAKNLQQLDGTEGDLEVVHERQEIERQEQQRKKELEEAEQRRLAEIEKQHTSTLKRSMWDDVEVRIPEKEIQKLDDYTIGDQKYTGVSKPKAFFLRHGFFVKGGGLKNAMEKHVDRFTRSSNISDSQTASTSDSIASASGIFSDSMQAFWGKKPDLAQKMNAIKALSNAQSREDIAAMMEQVKTASGAFTPTELAPDSEYYTQYPYAAKTIYMHKLLTQAKMLLVDKNENKEFTARLEAAQYNSYKLYDMITSSTAYTEAKEKHDKPREQTAQQQRMYDTPANELIDHDAERMRYDFPPLTLLGSKQRLEAAQDLKIVMALDSSEFKSLHRELTVDRLKTMYKNLDQSLLGMSQEMEKSRLELLAKAPETLPEYTLKVGAGAPQLLHDTLRLRLNKKWPNEAVGKAIDDDFEFLFVTVKDQIIYDGPGGIKSLKDMGELTPEQITGYATVLGARMNAYSDILSKNKNYLENVAFRREVLKDVISGKVEALSQKALEGRYFDFQDSQKMREYKQEILSLGGSLEESRFYADITQLKTSNTASNLFSRWTKEVQARALRRYTRMAEMDDLLATGKELSAQGAPLDYYTYSSQKAVEAGGKVFSIEQANKAYTDYLGEWKKNALEEAERLKEGKEARKEEINTYYEKLTSKPTNSFGLKLSKYSEYIYEGVSKLQNDISVALTGTLNDDERGDFEVKMQNTMLRYSTRLLLFRKKAEDARLPFTEDMEKNVRRLVLSNLSDKDFIAQVDRIILASKDPVIQTAVANKDKRIKEFSQIGQGVYRSFLPILIEDPTFSDKLVSAKENDWEEYLAKISERCEAVSNELTMHPYYEQYLIGKKAEIKDLILNKPKADVVAELNLDAYDTEINTQKLGSTTLKDIIESRLSKKNPMLGNTIMSILILDGVSSLLDSKKLHQYIQRVEKNTENLTNAMLRRLAERRNDEKPAGKRVAKADVKPLDQSELTSQEKALMVSLLHNERKNLVSVGSHHYNVERQITDFFSDYVRAKEALDETLENLKLVKEEMSALVSRKEAGREAFVAYRRQSERCRETTVTGKQKLEDLPKDQKDLIEKFIEEKKALPTNGFLNSLYSQTVSRLASRQSEGNPDKVMAFMSKDFTVFFNAKTFYNTAKKYLEELYHVKEANLTVLKGLFDFYGEEITNGSYELKPKDITKSLDKYYKNEKIRGEFEKYISDDTGGFVGISSTQAITETNQLMGMATREQFEKIVKKQSDFKEYFTLSPEERILCAHLIATDGELGEPMNLLEKAIRKNTAASPTKSDLIHSYIMDKQLSDVDYNAVARVLYRDNAFNKAYLNSAVMIVKQAKEMKEAQTFTLTEEEYKTLMTGEIHEETYDSRSLVTTMSNLITTTHHWQDELKRDKTTPNNERLFRYFTALRPFAKEMKAFLDKETSKESALYKLVRENYDDFTILEGYATLLSQRKDPQTDMEKNDSEKYKIEIKFIKKLGVNVMPNNKEREKFFAFMDEHLFNVDEITRDTIARRDKSEEDYPPEVLNAVTKIDQWVAMHANQWAEGNTENVFGAQILSHPLRERLFVYYSVEKGKVSDMDSFDATLSQMYVPNINIFIDQMTKSWWRVGSKLISALKGTEKVRGSFVGKLLANAGELNLDKLENAIHLLDDHDSEYSEQVAEASHSVLAKDDPKLPVSLREALRDRNKKYIYFYNEFSKLQNMAADPPKADDQEGQNALKEQEIRMRTALMMLTDADTEYGERVTLLENITNSHNHEKKLDDVRSSLAKKEKVCGLLISVPGTVGGLAATIRESVPGIWKLKDLKGLLDQTPPGYFTSISTISQLGQVIVGAASLSADYKKMDETQKARSIMNLVGAVSDTVTSAAKVTGKYLSNASAETLNKITATLGATVQVGQGITGIWADITDKFHTYCASKRAVKKADKLLGGTEDGTHEQRQMRNLRRSTNNVASLFQSRLSSSLKDNVLTTTGGIAKLFVPGGGTVGTLLNGVKKIMGLFKGSIEKKAMIDEFIEIDKLLAQFDKLQLQYHFKDEDEKKDFIRKEALKRLHAPSYDDFFTGLAVRYARDIHHHIFYHDDGKPILDSETELINDRKDFRDLFIGTNFKYPKNADHSPSPTLTELTKLITG